jgi:hypothetical protein
MAADGCSSASALVQMGKAWLLVTSQPTSGATWCFQVLRQQLPRLSQLSAQAQDPDLLQQLQLMQFHTLHGSLVLASQQGHKVSSASKEVLAACVCTPCSSSRMHLCIRGNSIAQHMSPCKQTWPYGPQLPRSLEARLPCCKFKYPTS